MKKKYVVAFLATLFFILAFSIITSAQPAADSFGVEDASGGAGTYVEVPVIITNVSNGPVQGIRLRVDYNENVLNLTNISNGDLTLNWTRLQLGEDRHTMIIAHTSDAIPNESSGSVVLLNFHVIGSPGDTSPMNMTLIELSNPEGEVGTAPARNGLFSVTPSVDSTPTPTPPPSNGDARDGDSSVSGGGSPTTPTPTPTEKPPAVGDVAATPSPTLAPIITQPSATPTQTPTPTPAPVPRTPPLFLILIVIVVIVIAGIIIMVMKR